MQQAVKSSRSICKQRVCSHLCKVTTVPGTKVLGKKKTVVASCLAFTENPHAEHPRALRHSIERGNTP